MDMVEKHKYPRTRHLPWSRSRTDDDEVLTDASHLHGKTLVFTEKMDGENTTIYHGGHCHARSMDSKDHPSRHWVKQLAAQIGMDIPKGWRVCGENMFAKHSLYYDALPSYFLVFGIYDENDICLSWEDTVTWAELLNLRCVPFLGCTSSQDLESLHSIFYTGKSMCVLGDKEDSQEGYVVRIADAFSRSDHPESTAKFVRPRHVQTTEHWMCQTLVQNKLQG